MSFEDLLLHATSLTAQAKHSGPGIGRCACGEAMFQNPHSGVRLYAVQTQPESALKDVTITGHKKGCCTYRYSLSSSKQEDIAFFDEPIDKFTAWFNPRSIKHSGWVLLMCGPYLKMQVSIYIYMLCTRQSLL
jgi:hypothetical protein